MNFDAVIGCDSVVAGAEWLRLQTVTGVVRTIPWTAVKVAGMGGNHEGEISIGGLTEQVKPYFATHDSLWVASSESVAQAMIEKSHPQREEILRGFAQYLDDRWKGDELTVTELSARLMAEPVARVAKSMKMMLFAMIAFTLVLLGALLVAVSRSH